MIPQEKIAAVERGLSEAFGATELEEIHMLKDLPTSLVYRIIVRGSPYLLKISLRTNDPARHYACMQAASEAGLTPHVWYASVEDRISIADFVEAAPLPMAEALVRIPAILRKLHALAPFAGVPNHINTSCMFLINQGPALEAFLQKFQTSDILPKSEAEELLARHAQLVAAYPYDHPEMVSSHNDVFKPDNMLFDGQRLWLIDWEAAFLNDRYADLAVAANLVAANEADEQVYLREYFGAPPDPYQRARFFLMRQVAHMFYAMAFLSMGSSAKPIDWGEAVPTFTDLQQRIWAGRIDLTDSHTKAVYGRVHWNQFLENARAPRYEEALRIVGDRRATSTPA